MPVLFQQSVTTSLEGGNRQKAMKRLRVPPLGDKVTKLTDRFVIKAACNELYMTVTFVCLVSVRVSLMLPFWLHISSFSSKLIPLWRVETQELSISPTICHYDDQFVEQVTPKLKVLM